MTNPADQLAEALEVAQQVLSFIYHRSNNNIESEREYARAYKATYKALAAYREHQESKRLDFEEWAAQKGFDLAMDFFGDEQRFLNNDTALAYEIWCAAYRENPGGWIRFDEKFPEPDQVIGFSLSKAPHQKIVKHFGVRVFVTDGEYTTEAELTEHGDWEFNNYFNDINECTHWQPLPKPPEKSDE